MFCFTQNYSYEMWYVGIKLELIQRRKKKEENTADSNYARNLNKNVERFIKNANLLRKNDFT